MTLVVPAADKFGAGADVLVKPQLECHIYQVEKPEVLQGREEMNSAFRQSIPQTRITSFVLC